MCDLTNTTLKNGSCVLKIIKCCKLAFGTGDCHCLQNYNDCLMKLKWTLESFQTLEYAIDYNIFQKYVEREDEIARMRQHKLEHVGTDLEIFYENLILCTVEIADNESSWCRRDLKHKQELCDELLPKIKLLEIFLNTLNEKPNVYRFWWLYNISCQLNNLLKYGIVSPVTLLDPICLPKLKKFGFKVGVGYLWGDAYFEAQNSICKELCCSSVGK